MNDAELFRGLTEKSGARRDAQDLAALVKAARRADPVGNGGLAALRAFAQLRQFQHAVISAAHALPAR